MTVCPGWAQERVGRSPEPVFAVSWQRVDRLSPDCKRAWQTTTTFGRRSSATEWKLVASSRILLRIWAECISRGSTSVAWLKTTCEGAAICSAAARRWHCIVYRLDKRQQRRGFFNFSVFGKKVWQKYNNCWQFTDSPKAEELPATPLTGYSHSSVQVNTESVQCIAIAYTEVRITEISEHLWQLLWLRASHCTDCHVTSLLFLRVTCPCSLRTYATLKFIRSSSSSSSSSTQQSGPEWLKWKCLISNFISTMFKL